MTSDWRRRSIVVALASVMCAGTSRAQQTASRDGTRLPTSGTASLTGTVVADDEAHTPIPHAVLSLSLAGLPGQRTTATDESGRYAFTNLPGAVYTLSAARGAYLTTSYGALAPGAPPLPIPLKDGQAFVAKPIVLVKGSVIAGRITDAESRPVANARVTAVMFTTVDGQRRPSLGVYIPQNTATDSRGLYRIYGLAAGDYLVSTTVNFSNAQPVVVMTPEGIRWAEQHVGARNLATPPSAPTHALVSAPTYFPSAVDAANAAVVSVGRAEERQGVDIQVVRIGTVRVTGMVYGPDGQPSPGAFVLRSPKRGSAVTMTGPSPLALQSRSMPDGSFALNGVTPGDYVVTARASAVPAPATPPPPGVPAINGMALPSSPLTLWGQAEVSVNGDDIEGIEIRLQPGMTVSGSVAFEGTTAPPPDAARFKPRLMSIDNDSANITVETGASTAAGAAPDRTFKFDGVSPGSYLFAAFGDAPTTAGTTPSWMLKSVVVDGHDVIDTPLEVRPRQDVSDIVVTYTDRHTTLDGRLVDGSGQPVSQFRVLVFTTNRALWSSRALRRWNASVRAGADGSFRVSGLPPGQYYVCAFVDSGESQAPDAALLESLAPSSITIALVDGETHTQTFKVGG